MKLMCTTEFSFSLSPCSFSRSMRDRWMDGQWQSAAAAHMLHHAWASGRAAQPTLWWDWQKRSRGNEWVTLTFTPSILTNHCLKAPSACFTFVNEHEAILETFTPPQSHWIRSSWIAFLVPIVFNKERNLKVVESSYLPRVCTGV